MTSTKTSISNKDNKNGNVNVIDIDIELPTPPKRKKRTGKSKATKDKEKKAEIEKLLKLIDWERGRTILERQIITDRVGYVPPIAIPSMPEPTRNLGEMEENLRQYALQLADVQDRLMDFYEDRGATDRDIDELMREIDQEFPDAPMGDPEEGLGQRLGGMPTGQPPPQQVAPPQPFTVSPQVVSPPQLGQAVGQEQYEPATQPPPLISGTGMPEYEPPEGRRPLTGGDEELARQRQMVGVGDKPKPEDDPDFDPEFPGANDPEHPLYYRHNFNERLGTLVRDLESILARHGLRSKEDIRGLAKDKNRLQRQIQDMTINELIEQLRDAEDRENDLEETLQDFQRLFDRATGQDANTVRLMVTGNIHAPLDRYAPSVSLLEDYDEYTTQLQRELNSRPADEDPTQRPPTGTFGGRYPARDRTPMRDRPPPMGTIPEEPTDYDPEADDPEFISPPPSQLDPSAQPFRPPPPLPPLPEYPSIRTANSLNEFRGKLEQYLDDNIEALSQNELGFKKLEELTQRAVSELEAMGQEFTRPEGSTLPRKTRAELNKMDTRSLEEEYDQVADHFENYSAGNWAGEMSQSNIQLLEGYMDDIRNILELRERDIGTGPSLEEEITGTMGRPAEKPEDYKGEEWTGFSPPPQATGPPNPDLPTLGEIELMNEPQLIRQKNRLLQYQQDWGMDLSLEDGRKVGNTLRNIDEQIDTIRDDPNLWEDLDERGQNPSIYTNPQYITPLPQRDREVDSYVIQTEGLGFPSYVLEEPIVNNSIRKLLGRGIRPQSILDGYRYFLRTEKDKDSRFTIQGNMDKLAKFYTDAIPNAATANAFNQQFDRSWSLLFRPPEINPYGPPEQLHQYRATDPAFMGASHVPAPSPEEQEGGEEFFINPAGDADTELNPQDTRGAGIPRDTQGVDLTRP